MADEIKAPSSGGAKKAKGGGNMDLGLMALYAGAESLANIFSASSQRKSEERQRRFQAKENEYSRALSRETRDIGIAGQQMNAQYGVDLSRQQSQEKRAALVRGILSNMAASGIIQHGAPAGWGQTPTPRVPTAPQIVGAGKSV